MTVRRAEAPAAVGRVDSPADVQWARALTAVVLGLLLAGAAMSDVVCAPNLRTVAPEFRALSGIPSLVIRTLTGDF
ncbi:MAG TPA: hypothetical protein VIB01_08525 [Steroidobacteraceae bacterium]|jgi:hypothetical protein